MDLLEMTVDAGCAAGTPYQFTAHGASGTTVTVKMVMPLGGNESGLYRSPKAGEKVLVASNSDTIYYLMGYLPAAADQPFFAADTDKTKDAGNVIDEEGEVFRYQNTATAFGNKSAPHSEIGFYKKPQAEWPASIEKIKEKEVPIYPSIDTVNIESAGDIRETAANHHLQKAKRMEIFVDVPEVDHRTGRDEKGNLPFGDSPGGDSELHAGDLHIRAGRRVLIKSDMEIRLQVGRTMVRIGDDGFTVVSKNLSGNFPNTFDTRLDMTSRDGLTMNGKKIQMNSRFGFGIEDGLGGSVKSAMGNLSLTGREAGIEVLNSAEFKFIAAVLGIETGVNITSSSTALAGKGLDAMRPIVTFTKIINAVLKIAVKAHPGALKWVKGKFQNKQAGETGE